MKFIKVQAQDQSSMRPYETRIINLDHVAQAYHDSYHGNVLIMADGQKLIVSMMPTELQIELEK